MKTKIIITETQMVRLKKHLFEVHGHAGIVKRIKDFLDSNYTPVESAVRRGNTYFDVPMVKINIDEELITPKALFQYVKHKFRFKDDFIKQVIKDWIFNKITDDYQLSANISLS